MWHMSEGTQGGSHDLRMVAKGVQDGAQVAHGALALAAEDVRAEGDDDAVGVVGDRGLTQLRHSSYQGTKENRYKFVAR